MIERIAFHDGKLEGDVFENKTFMDVVYSIKDSDDNHKIRLEYYVNREVSVYVDQNQEFYLVAFIPYMKNGIELIDGHVYKITCYEEFISQATSLCRWNDGEKASWLGYFEKEFSKLINQ